MDSSHSRLIAVDNKYLHQDSSPHHQDTEHHWEMTYPHLSQPLHSMTWDAECHMILVPEHMCCCQHNSAACLSNTQPTTANQFSPVLDSNCTYKVRTA